jgi:hypothetical protein
MLIALAIGLFVVLLIVLLAAIWFIKRNIELKKHPCKGYLMLVDSTREIMWKANLEVEEKNRQSFNVVLESPQASLSGVQSLLVSCETEEQSAGGIVVVQATLDSGQPVNETLLPGQKVDVVPGTTWLLKTSRDIVQDRVPEEIWESSSPAESLDASIERYEL